LPDLKKPTDDKELIEKQQKEFDELKNLMNLLFQNQ
jgi:hypothetical protein